MTLIAKWAYPSAPPAPPATSSAPEAPSSSAPDPASYGPPPRIVEVPPPVFAPSLREDWDRPECACRVCTLRASSDEGERLRIASTPPESPSRFATLCEVKSRPDLLPARALLLAGDVLAQRTDRDTDEGPGYLSAPRRTMLRKYRESLLRHVLAYYRGDAVDRDSGKSPLAHVLSNAAILIELELREIEASSVNVNAKGDHHG